MCIIGEQMYSNIQYMKITFILYCCLQIIAQQLLGTFIWDRRQQCDTYAYAMSGCARVLTALTTSECERELCRCVSDTEQQQLNGDSINDDDRCVAVFSTRMVCGWEGDLFLFYNL
jgi:hypothetical protein